MAATCRFAARACVLLVCMLALEACARTLARPETTPSAAQVRSLWREPADIERRDVFYGPGGRERAPGSGPFTFLERKQNGINPGFDVRDREGSHWSVKLGREAQSEIALSRILWAIGYHQPESYHVDRWELIGAVRGRQEAGRFHRGQGSRNDLADFEEQPEIGKFPTRRSG